MYGILSFSKFPSIHAVIYRIHRKLTFATGSRVTWVRSGSQQRRLNLLALYEADYFMAACASTPQKRWAIVGFWRTFVVAGWEKCFVFFLHICKKTVTQKHRFCNASFADGRGDPVMEDFIHQLKKNKLLFKGPLVDDVLLICLILLSS